MDCWLVKFSNGISDSSQEDESVVGCFIFSFACGCAASRAESLRLSVKAHYSVGGYAARGEASPFSTGRTESQRLSAREAAKPHDLRKFHLGTHKVSFS